MEDEKAAAGAAAGAKGLAPPASSSMHLDRSETAASLHGVGGGVGVGGGGQYQARAPVYLFEGGEATVAAGAAADVSAVVGGEASVIGLRSGQRILPVADVAASATVAREKVLAAHHGASMLQCAAVFDIVLTVLSILFLLTSAVGLFAFLGLALLPGAACGVAAARRYDGAVLAQCYTANCVVQLLLRLAAVVVLISAGYASDVLFQLICVTAVGWFIYLSVSQRKRLRKLTSEELARLREGAFAIVRTENLLFV